MFVEASCPVCESEIVHEVDIFSKRGETISAYVEVKQSWELREFVSMKVVEIFQMLPLPTKVIRENLRALGLDKLADKIVEEVKLYGAYEREGILLPA
ncbi:hypothetical protein [Candidatus Pyrohabitans sp.]